ncbi:hypothetical protein [Saccharospirillum salsuginis]|uniref:Uncharacterized protein n=1 Tax=Saccharospirillum salsuginis TaxID=418750 RepID=A0A918KKK2_9GAMM|nr:hypothetical protein [Saccharospirillum salsuginis]GGX66408.1 hypothetical protein GCM10007392_37600 [Saccharospirillum salsuginis]
MKWLLESLLKTVQIGSYDSINIACFKSDNREFFHFITRVLTFVEEVDLKRYQRITQELDWIVNQQALARYSGKYSSSLRMCSVGYDITDETSNDDVIYYASLVIHEATHGYIYRKGIKYSEENWERIERLCVAEQNRFLKKAKTMFPEIAEKYISEFNPKSWKYYWSTPSWKKLLHQLSRILRG